MADQLVTLGLDEKEYQQGLRQLMRQSRGEFQRMQREMEVAGGGMSRAVDRGLWGVSQLARLELLRRGIAIASAGMKEYAKSSREAAAETSVLSEAWEYFYSNAKKILGASVGGAVRLTATATGKRGELEEGYEAKARIMAAQEMHEANAAALRASQEITDRIRLLQADLLPKGQGEAARAMIEAEREEREIRARFAAEQYGGRSDEMTAEIEAVKDRASSIITQARKEAEAERLRAERDARESRRGLVERADSEWDKFIEDQMQRDADYTEQALQEREEHDRAMADLRQQEQALKVEMLYAQGRENEAIAESLAMRKELELRRLRSEGALTPDEFEAARTRLEAGFDALGKASGGRRAFEPLASITGGAAGLGSVIAGTFGRDVMGGRSGANSAIEKVRSATERSAESNARTVQLLQHIATKLGPAVYS